MDIDTASALLGLGPDASDDAIRRAYLKRIKAVRPDRDPEGFRALRAAHDLLRARAPAPDRAPIVATPTEGASPTPPDNRRATLHACLERAEALADAHEIDRALDALQAAVERAEDAYETADTPLFFQCVIDALTRGQAARVEPLVTRWMAIADHCGELRNLPRLDLIRVVLLTELTTTVSLWPEDIAEAVLEAITHGQLDAPVGDIRTFAHREPADAYGLQKALSERAPCLDSLYGEALEVPLHVALRTRELPLRRPRPREPEPQPRGRTGWLLLLLLLTAWLAWRFSRPSPMERAFDLLRQTQVVVVPPLPDAGICMPGPQICPPTPPPAEGE